MQETMKGSAVSKIIISAVVFLGLFQVTDQYRNFEKERRIARASFSALETWRAMTSEENLLERDRLGELVVEGYGLARSPPSPAEVSKQLSEHLGETPAYLYASEDVLHSDNCSSLVIETFESPKVRDLRYTIRSLEEHASVEYAVWPYPLCPLPRFYPRSVLVQADRLLGFYFERGLAEELRLFQLLGICEGNDRCKKLDRFFPEDTWIGVAEDNIQLVSNFEQVDVTFVPLNNVEDRLRALVGRDDVSQVRLDLVEASIRERAPEKSIQLLGTPIPSAMIPAAAAWILLFVSVLLASDLGEARSRETSSIGSAASRLELTVGIIKHWLFTLTYLVVVAGSPLLLLDAYRTPISGGWLFNPLEMEFFSKVESTPNRVVWTWNLFSHPTLILIVALGGSVVGLLNVWLMLKARPEACS